MKPTSLVHRTYIYIQTCTVLVLPDIQCIHRTEIHINLWIIRTQGYSRRVTLVRAPKNNYSLKNSRTVVICFKKANLWNSGEENKGSNEASKLSLFSECFWSGSLLRNFPDFHCFILREDIKWNKLLTSCYNKVTCRKYFQKTKNARVNSYPSQ